MAENDVPRREFLKGAGAEITGAVGLVGMRFRDFDSAPEMIVVSAGSFLMGSPDSERDDVYHRHEVTIKTPFAVGICPVKRGEFAAFIGATNHKIEAGAHVWNGQKWEYRPTKSWRDPGFKQEDDHPVVCVSWHDAQAYVAWLKERSGGKAYRLLSEAEWEYCCRAGGTWANSSGRVITPEPARFCGRGATPSKYPPNPWGLHDMHGNVWEWCEDNWHEDYSGNPPSDASVWPDGDPSSRVLRGGSWFQYPRSLSSLIRHGYRPDLRGSEIGFRVARTL